MELTNRRRRPIEHSSRSVAGIMYNVFTYLVFVLLHLSQCFADFCSHIFSPSFFLHCTSIVMTSVLELDERVSGGRRMSHDILHRTRRDHVTRSIFLSSTQVRSFFLLTLSKLYDLFFSILIIFRPPGTPSAY